MKVRSKRLVFDFFVVAVVVAVVVMMIYVIATVGNGSVAKASLADIDPDNRRIELPPIVEPVKIVGDCNESEWLTTALTVSHGAPDTLDMCLSNGRGQWGWYRFQMQRVK